MTKANTSPKDGDTVYRFSLSVDLEPVAHRFVYHVDSPRERVPGMEGFFYKKAPNYIREWACYTLQSDGWRLTGRTDTEMVLRAPHDGWFESYADAREAAIKALRLRLDHHQREARAVDRRLSNLVSAPAEWSPP